MKTIDGNRVPVLAHWAVMVNPWEGDPYIVSHHRTPSAALKAAHRRFLEFKRWNPGACGYRYYPAAKWEGSDGWQEIEE